MIDNVKDIVAANLIELRKSHNMTQADVAKALNYSDKSVSKWEHADSLPDISILCALADMYGVTLDYLTHEDIAEKQKFIKTQEEKANNNHTIIVLMSLSAVLLLSTIVFVYTSIYRPPAFWQAFVWAVPMSSFLILYYNRRWYKNKITRTISFSVLCWSTLTGIFLQDYNLWLIFVLGVPIQIIILLSMRLTK